MELSKLITLCTSAWAEPDRALRQQLLERVWAEDGTYTDPTAHIVGRNEPSITSAGSLSSTREPTLNLPEGSMRITRRSASPGAWCLRMGMCLWRGSASCG